MDRRGIQRSRTPVPSSYAPHLPGIDFPVVIKSASMSLGHRSHAHQSPASESILSDELYAREPGVVRGTDPEPEWISNELKHFSVHRDRNADGRMDRKEVGEWLMPEEYDGAAAETHHLIAHADSNKDGVLSVEEVVAHNDLFAGSQATNYGATLEKDEL